MTTDIDIDTALGSLAVTSEVAAENARARSAELRRQATEAVPRHYLPAGCPQGTAAQARLHDEAEAIEARAAHFDAVAAGARTGRLRVPRALYQDPAWMKDNAGIIRQAVESGRCTFGDPPDTAA